MAARIIRLQKDTKNGGFKLTQGIECPKEAGKYNPIQIGEFGSIIPLVSLPHSMKMKYVYAYEVTIEKRGMSFFKEVEIYNSIHKGNLRFEESQIMLVVDGLDEERLKIEPDEKNYSSDKVMNMRGGIFFIAPKDKVTLKTSTQKKVYKVQKIEGHLYLIDLYDD